MILWASSHGWCEFCVVSPHFLLSLSSLEVPLCWGVTGFLSCLRKVLLWVLPVLFVTDFPERLCTPHILLPLVTDVRSSSNCRGFLPQSEDSPFPLLACHSVPICAVSHSFLNFTSSCRTSKSACSALLWAPSQPCAGVYQELNSLSCSELLCVPACFSLATFLWSSWIVICPSCYLLAQTSL